MFSSIPSSLQKGQLLSLGEEESGNVVDVAMLLKARALSLAKHITIKAANLSFSPPRTDVHLHELFAWHL